MKEQDTVQPELECPDFLPAYFWAFATLLLYKVGEIECISQEQIEKFDIDNYPDVMYDHVKKAWVMKLKKGVDQPVIVTVPKKILRKTPKIFRS